MYMYIIICVYTEYIYFVPTLQSFWGSRTCQEPNGTLCESSSGHGLVQHPMDDQDRSDAIAIVKACTRNSQPK